MNVEELREYCLSKPFVTESFPFNEEVLVFKVLGKMFLLTNIHERPVSFNVKCDPDKALELRGMYSCVKAGYHMNKHYWNTVTCESGVSKKLLKEWIDHSYEEVVKGLPRKEREKLAKKSKR